MHHLREWAGIDCHVEPVALAALSDGIVVRATGIDEAHVEQLMARQEEWPPIVVWGPDNVVVDGQHRVVAARRLGSASILSERFAGSEEDAYVEAVRRNVVHGLPLSAQDRAAAVRRLLGVHPDWSDRRIAAVCGVAAKTVSQTRAAGAADADAGSLARRTGRDGRRRPDDPSALRRQITSILEETPSLSLRCVAGLVGASPETVRRVRQAMATGEVGVAVGRPQPPPPVAGRQPEADAGPAVIGVPTPDSRWSDDRALTATDLGQRFAEWFAQHEVGDEWMELVRAVPVSRLYEVADEARRRASVWCDVARAIESRVPSPTRMRGVG